MHEVIIVILIVIIVCMLINRRDNLLSDYDQGMRFNAGLGEVGRLDRRFTHGALREREGCCGSCDEGKSCEGFKNSYDKLDFVDPGGREIRSKLTYELANQLFQGN